VEELGCRSAVKICKACPFGKWHELVSQNRLAEDQCIDKPQLDAEV
jgi:hypothetical protein